MPSCGHLWTLLFCFQTREPNELKPLISISAGLRGYKDQDHPPRLQRVKCLFGGMSWPQLRKRKREAHLAWTEENVLTGMPGDGPLEEVAGHITVCSNSFNLHETPQAYGESRVQVLDHSAINASCYQLHSSLHFKSKRESG